MKEGVEFVEECTCGTAKDLASKLEEVNRGFDSLGGLEKYIESFEMELKESEKGRKGGYCLCE